MHRVRVDPSCGGLTWALSFRSGHQNQDSPTLAACLSVTTGTVPLVEPETEESPSGLCISDGIYWDQEEYLYSNNC